MTSERKIAANRANAAKGTRAWSEKQSARYLAAPSHCGQCGIQLPQEKKHNKFCSSSCSAIFNNTGRIKVQPWACGHCSRPIKRGKYCSSACAGEARRKYSEEQAELVRRLRSREVSANYRARLNAQTPLTADREAMRRFYEQCPEGYEVDHIIPISRGGLHTLENLQYLTIRENRSKGNRIVARPPGFEPGTRD